MHLCAVPEAEGAHLLYGLRFAHASGTPVPGSLKDMEGYTEVMQNALSDILRKASGGDASSLLLALPCTEELLAAAVAAPSVLHADAIATAAKGRAEEIAEETGQDGSTGKKKLDRALAKFTMVRNVFVYPRRDDAASVATALPRLLGDLAGLATGHAATAAAAGTLPAVAAAARRALARYNAKCAELLQERAQMLWRASNPVSSLVVRLVVSTRSVSLASTDEAALVESTLVAFGDPTLAAAARADPWLQRLCQARERMQEAAAAVSVSVQATAAEQPRGW